MFAALEKAKKFAPAAPINQIGPMKDLVTVAEGNLKYFVSAKVMGCLFLPLNFRKRTPKT